MKVSIITVCLNSAETIENTLNSIFAQDYPEIECVVVDGRSTDGTLRILERYRNHIHHYISEPDQGIYDAMNKGIQLSTGGLIAILNSDDIYADKNVVRRMAEFVQQNTLDAAYGDLVYINPLRPSHITRFWKAGEYRKGAFRRGWVIPHPTFFCRKEVFEKYGIYNEHFKIAADFELMLRFVEKYQIKIGYLPGVLVKMTKGGRANILRGMIRGNREILQSFGLNGVRPSPWFFILKPASKLLQLLRRPHDTTLE